MSEQAMIVEHSAAGPAAVGPRVRRPSAQQRGRMACQPKLTAIRHVGASSVHRARGIAQVEIVHEIAGRVRLRVPALGQNRALGARLAAELGSQAGIRAVRAAPACASLVVTYDPARATVAQIVTWIGALVPATVQAGPRADRPGADRSGADPLLLGAISLGLGLLGAPAILTTALALLETTRGPLSEADFSLSPFDVAEFGLEFLRGGAGAVALSAGLVLGVAFLRWWRARRLSRSQQSLDPAPAAGGR